MFKIVCVGGKHCSSFLTKCLQSVIDQTNNDWHMAVILDPGDYQIEVDDRRIKVCVNRKQKGGVHNTITSVGLLSCDDDDIIVFLDADDYLYCNDALETVVGTYKKYPETLVTHGSFITDPFKEGSGHMAFNKVLTQINVDNIRGNPFRTTHLKTMKCKIFRKIKDRDFRDETGNYLKTTVDVAVMIPVVEMAGLDRVQFISKTLYSYRTSPKSDVYRKQIVRDCNRIYNKSPYKRLQYV